jgi:hypothetical protein
MVATASIAYDTGRTFTRCLRVSSVALYTITIVVIKTSARNIPVQIRHGVSEKEGKASSVSWTHHIGMLIGTEI